MLVSKPNRALGPGLLESVYEERLVHELRRRAIDINNPDRIVVWEASPESLRHQQSVEIAKRLHGRTRRAKRHLRACDRIDHPGRCENRRARFPFHMDNISLGALLPTEATHRSATERTL
jgi:hypothetical protein